MARSADDKRQVTAKVRALLAAGVSEFEQLEALKDDGVTVRELRGLRAEILSDEVEELHSATAEETFLRYKLRMNKCARELDDIVERARVARTSPGILSAAVAAVKAKSQIVDQILDRGQSLGVIHKAPKTSVKIGGIVVADASTPELRRLVSQRVAALEALAERTALRNYLEEPDEAIYYDAPDDGDVIEMDAGEEPEELELDPEPEEERPVRTKVAS